MQTRTSAVWACVFMELVETVLHGYASFVNGLSS